jgi:hypothetical protein
MNSLDKALLRQLLMIDRPWEIREYKLDLRKRRCDVSISEIVERGWFNRPLKAPSPSREQVWQHIALGPIKFFLHVSLPEGRALPDVDWMGAPDMPFTRALSNRVFTLFKEGIPLPAVCSLLDLNVLDVWRYRYALDNGRSNASGGQLPDTPTKAKPSLDDVTTPSSPNVPDMADPVWVRLMEGDMALDIKALSLKLMLTRVRSQLDLISDEEVRLLKLRELHRYFVKNERVLTHELSQLRTG